MISVIIIDFNTIQKTIDYIQSFIQNACDPENYHFIVVDNMVQQNNNIKKLQECATLKPLGSCEKFPVWSVQNENVEFLYCKSNSNLGFAKGNNLGVKISKKVYKDEYYIFSNNDIIFKEKIEASKFTEVFDKDISIGIIGPHIVGLDGKEQSPCKKISAIKQLILNYWGYMLPFYKVKGDLDYDNTSKYCYWVSGCFFITRAAAFDLAGGFDENTFLYAEEMILSERFGAVNYRIFYYNDYMLIHEGGATVRKTKTPLNIMEMRFESLCYYHKRYRKTSKTLIGIATYNFKLYRVVTNIKQKIRRIGNK